jgi:hypothetical protein
MHVNGCGVIVCPETDVECRLKTCQDGVCFLEISQRAAKRAEPKYVAGTYHSFDPAWVFEGEFIQTLKGIKLSWRYGDA